MICPSCQQDVSVTEAHHGALYTCDKCQAVYFINFEGQPEYGEVPDEAPVELDLNPVLTAAETENFSSSGFEIPVADSEAYSSFEGSDSSAEIEADSDPEPFASSFEPLVDSINVVTTDPSLDGALGSELLQPQSPEFESLNDVQAGMNAFAGLATEEASGEVFGEASEEISSSATLSGFAGIAKEISDFGNEEVQLAGLNYDLKITGLDTQETMRLFKEAIEDSKFGWDPADILKTVRNGQVQFKRLSPVKAFILAKRLQFLDIEKEWKQHVLS